MHSPSSRRGRQWLSMAACLIALGSAHGCAWSDGAPWGTVELALEVYLAPGADRLTDSGRLKTAKSFSIRIDELALEVRSIELATTAAAAGSQEQFDPADPPAGYSLCHNGHCHKDDGSLPTYAEIQAELSSGEVGSATRVILGPAAHVSVTSQPTAVSLQSCPDKCWFERTSLTSATLSLGMLTIKGRVFDELVGDAQRLPEEGVAVDVVVDLNLSLVHPLDVEFGQEGEPGVAMAAVASVPPSLFDGVDWSDATARDSQSLQSALVAAWVEVEGVFSVFVQPSDSSK